MNYRISSVVLATAASLFAANFASAAVYSTPYTPPTTFLTWSGTTVGAPTWARPNSGTPPTTVATTTGAAVPYLTQTYTPVASGVYNYNSTNNYDEWLVYYNGPFNPATPLANAVSSTDGTAFPNISLTGGTTYTFVQTGWSNTSTGTFTNTLTQPGSPNYTITDNNPAANTAVIDLLIADPGTIQSVNSVTLNNLLHTWAGDVVATLTHVETGKTVDLIDREGRDGTISTLGNSSNFNGDYTLTDGGPAWPANAAATDIPPGTYGVYNNTVAGGSSAFDNPLSFFVGDAIAGTWRLRLTDNATGDTGTISAFSLNVNIPEPTTLAALAGLGMLALRRRA